MKNLKRIVIALASLLSLTACSSLNFDDLTNLPSVGGPSVGGMDIGKAVGAGADLAKAATLDDKEVQQMAMQFAGALDGEAQIAPAGSKAAQRLKRLTANLGQEDGLKLNYKVYLSPEVNAFSLADGTTRVHSGLMDKCTDGEVLGVIGHEIGHVKLGHTKVRMQMAAATSGVMKGVGSMNNTAGALASTDLVGGTVKEFMNAQFSQSNEEDSDDYAAVFLAKHGRDPMDMVGALTVLARLAEEEGKDSKGFRFFSTHPAPGSRAERLKEKIESGEFPIKAAASGTKPVSAGASTPAVKEVPPAEAEADSASPEVLPEAMAPKHARAVAVPTRHTASVVSPSRSVQVLRSPLPGYYVQIAAMTNPAEADAVVNQLTAAALRATTQTAVVDGVTYTRILVGPYAGRQEAEQQRLNVSGGEFGQGEPFIQRVR